MMGTQQVDGRWGWARVVLALGLQLATLVSLPSARADDAPEPPELRELRLEPAALTRRPGATANLRAIGIFDDESERDLTSECTFESRDPDVAEVSGRIVRAISEGTATIRAEHGPTGIRSDNGLEVVVPGIVSIALSPAQAVLSGGQSVQVRAIAELSSGDTGFDVTELVEWTSSRAEVASVSNSAGSRGRVQALTRGETEISARDPASGTRSEKEALIVEVTSDSGGGGGGGGALDIREMTVDPETLSLLPGETASVVVRALLADGTTVNVTSACTFESTRARSVTVASDGSVSALESGRARVRVRHPDGGAARRDLDVWVGEVEQITLSPASATLEVGATQAFAALATYDNGRSADITRRVRWAVRDGRVASVGAEGAATGLVTGILAGDTSVWAHDPISGEQSSAKLGRVAVLEPGGNPPIEPGEEAPEDVRALEDLVFEPSLLHLLPGESRPVRVLAVYRDGSRRDVTPRVEIRARNVRVAEVDAAGLVTARGGGVSELRARDPLSRRTARTSAVVTVASLVGLRIDPPAAALALDTTIQLRALADYDDGSTGVEATALVAWESSREAIATVDDESARGLVHAVRDGVADIRCEDPVSRIRCDRATGRITVGTPEPGEGPQPGDLVGLTVEPQQLALEVGEIATITAKLVHADGSTTPVSDGLRFASMARGIAATASGGRVQARRGGATEIEVVHTPSGLATRLPVIVRLIERIYLDPPTLTLRPGQRAALRAFADLNDGTRGIDVTARVRWTSLDRGIVELDGDMAGAVRAVVNGSTRVEIRDDHSNTRSDASTGTIRVADSLRRLTIAPALAVGRLGDTLTFNAIGTFDDGATTDLSTDVIWRVSPAGAATVDATGHVRILQAGSSITLRATDMLSGVSSTLSQGDARIDIAGALVGLQVGNGTLSDTPLSLTLAPSETFQLVLLGVDGGVAPPLDISARAEWTSSDPDKVSVGETGLVTCLRDGQATISANDPETGLTSSATLGDTTVTCGGAAVALRIEPAVLALDYGKTKQMRAFRVYADGHETDVTYKVLWSSSNPEGVSVVESGATAGRAAAHDDVVATITAHDPAFDLSSDDSGGGNGVITVRKTRTLLEIFPIFPESADPDDVWRGPVGEILRLKARVTFATGVTQGVNLRVQWLSSDTQIVQMGDGVSLPINNGYMVRAGETTITALWPADETSVELRATIDVEVTN